MNWNPLDPLRSSLARREDTQEPQNAAHPGGTAGAVRILMVCTGNICRSSYAHHVLQACLDAELGQGAVLVSSAGTDPNQALTVPEEILMLAPNERVRAALTAHRPRPLSGHLLAKQDLIFSATDRHLDIIAREAPAVFRRSATFLEAERLLADFTAVTPGGGVDALVAALDRGRAIRHMEDMGAMDLPDPFRGPTASYVAMARALDSAMETIAFAVVRSHCSTG